MGSFTEIDLDLSYLDDLEEIIVHDECGGDDVSFYREGLLASDNAKLRDYAYALEECKRAAHYCELCPHCNFDFEDEEPRCGFNFDALRAAAWMEADK